MPMTVDGSKWQPMGINSGQLLDVRVSTQWQSQQCNLSLCAAFLSAQTMLCRTLSPRHLVTTQVFHSNLTTNTARGPGTSLVK